jgi:hypothetical protein
MKLFRIERKVPSSVIVLGTVLVACFLISFWLWSPSPGYISKDTRNPLKDDASTIGDGESSSGSHSYDAKDQHSEINDKTGSEDQVHSDEQISTEIGTNGPKGSSQSEDVSLDSKDEELEGKGDEELDIKKQEESNEGLLDAAVAQSEVTVESNESSSNWSTQIIESNDEKGISKTAQKDQNSSAISTKFNNTSYMDVSEKLAIHKWKLCTWQGAMDYIPCLDNKQAIKRLPSIRRFQHRERHCPAANQYPMCLVPLPKGYKVPIPWPRSKDEVRIT